MPAGDPNPLLMWEDLLERINEAQAALLEHNHLAFLRSMQQGLALVETIRRLPDFPKLELSSESSRQLIREVQYRARVLSATFKRQQRYMRILRNLLATQDPTYRLRGA